MVVYYTAFEIRAEDAQSGGIKPEVSLPLKKQVARNRVRTLVMYLILQGTYVGPSQRKFKIKISTIIIIENILDQFIEDIFDKWGYRTFNFKFAQVF